jgi:hypothetical protein
MAPCLSSEELKEQKKAEELAELKETFFFLKEMREKLKRSQASVNTAMVYFLKYTRIYSIFSINKYLVAAACLLLGAKFQDEPIPMKYFVEWYIYLEAKRNGITCRVDISEDKKEQYSLRIQDQEFDVLCEIGFDCEVESPLAYISKFAATPLGKIVFADKLLLRYVGNFVNDTYMTTAPLYYTPQQIAATAIYMAVLFVDAKNKSKNVKKDKNPTNNNISTPTTPKFGRKECETTEWYLLIDETLDREVLIEAKDEIKKCYLVKPSSS